MGYFKNVGDMLERTLADRGEKDGNGVAIQSDVKPMNEIEYAEYKKKQISKKISRIKKAR